MSDQAGKRYPTEPIKCWAKMKELRRKHFRHTWEATEKGEPIVVGIAGGPLHALLAGFGDFANPSFGPYYTGSMRSTELNIKYSEAAEFKGYPRELCSSMRNHLGQLSLGLSTRSPEGKVFKPTFILQEAECPSMSKTAQIFAEELGVPHFIVDESYDDVYENKVFLLEQLEDFVEYFVKITGRKFSDEAFIEALKIECRIGSVMAQVFELMKVTPAPIDLRQAQSLRLPTTTGSHKKEVLEYCEELLDEVKDRVSRGISARGIEEARLCFEGLPPFFYSDIYRLPEAYGAIFVIGDVPLRSFSLWDLWDDGTTKPAPDLDTMLSQLGMKELRTRRDGLILLVDNLTRRMWPACYPFGKSNFLINRAQSWKCDGVIIHIDRGCYGGQCGTLDAKWDLDKAGIPNLTFEGSQADCRLFNERDTVEAFYTFFETIGLSRLDT